MGDTETAERLIPPPPLALLAEADADSREMYAESLSLFGFRIAEACDGEEALDRIFTLHPDVVSTELTLPRVDGIEICRRVRDRVDTHNTPIVIVTATVDADAVRQALHAGCDTIMIKPCLPETLGRELHRLHARGLQRRLAHVARRTCNLAALDTTARPAAARARLPEAARTSAEPPLAARCPSCGSHTTAMTAGVGILTVCTVCGRVVA